MGYVSIRVSTLRGDQKIDFDAFMKLNEKMILYLRRGDSFEGDRLKRLKDKKLRKMFIAAEDEERYLEYMKRNIDMAYDDNSGKDMQTRADIIQGNQQSNAEEVFENPEDARKYNEAKDAAGKYVNFIMNNTEALGAMMNMENTDKNIAHHGVTVATLAIAMAEKMGIKEAKRTQLLTLGALLHDYGHYNSSLVLNQPLKKMNLADKKLWLAHPQDGVNKVQHTTHFDQLVLNIILQHEETINGMGPLGLFEKDIDQMSLIVSIANAMDRLLTYEGVPRAEATKRMMVEHIGKYPLGHFTTLTEVFKALET